MGEVHPGELRHERCRFGILTEAYHVSLGGTQTPMVAPLCTFQPEGAVPPALNRAWGGMIEVERDCAVCPCFREVLSDNQGKEG